MSNISDIPIPDEERTVSIPYGPPDELKKMIAIKGSMRIALGSMIRWRAMVMTVPL
jgi:hypothetical protein